MELVRLLVEGQHVSTFVHQAGPDADVVADLALLRGSVARHLSYLVGLRRRSAVGVHFDVRWVGGCLEIRGDDDHTRELLRQAFIPGYGVGEANLL